MSALKIMLRVLVILLIPITATYSQTCKFKRAHSWWGFTTGSIEMKSEPTIETSPINWLSVFNNAFSEMSFRGETNVQYFHGGAYSTFPGAEPAPHNGINQFGTGFVSDPMVGGLTQWNSGSTGGIHDEVDVIMNTTNNSFSWGLPNGADENTTVRHEIGHCYVLKENIEGCPPMAPLEVGKSYDWDDYRCCDDMVHCLYFNDSFCDRIVFPIYITIV